MAKINDKLICPMCGKEFIKKTSRQKYCGEECGHAADVKRWRVGVRPTTCHRCGVVFVGKGTKYCPDCGPFAKTAQAYAVYCTGKKEIPKPKVSIEEMVRRAAKAGLSYGYAVHLEEAGI